jgi:hypothetical protein
MIGPDTGKGGVGGLNNFEQTPTTKGGRKGRIPRSTKHTAKGEREGCILSAEVRDQLYRSVRIEIVAIGTNIGPIYLPIVHR